MRIGKLCILTFAVSLPLQVIAQPALPGVRAAIQASIDRHEISGAVTMVVTRDATLDRETIGVSDLKLGTPMKEDTLFWIASMTKPLTAVCVLMLQDEGKLAVDDPVERYLPEFAQLKTPTGEAAHITIAQLLTHTSGLGEALPADVLKAHTLADLVPLYLAVPMQYAPGSQWKYTQSGINVAARIVEVVSKERFDVFLQRRLLTPLAMNHTTFYPDARARSRLAVSYRQDAQDHSVSVAAMEGGYDRTGLPPLANSGLFSTAADYAKFCQMLLNHGAFHGRQYLSARAMTLLTTIQTGDLPTGFLQTEAFGSHGLDYGWSIGMCVLRRSHAGVAAMLSPGTYGHGGAWGTEAYMDPVKGVAYILMVQRAGAVGDASDLRRDFQQAASDALAAPSRPNSK